MAQTSKKLTKKSDNGANYIWGISRMALGFYFLWAFFDKLIGLGFSTCRDRVSEIVSVGCEQAWLFGGSPTTGYLGSLDGTFAGLFTSMSGSVFADWLFMIGLLGIGLALMLGIGMRVATFTGSLLLFAMYLASLPLATNPIIDSHIIYIIVLFGLLAVNDQQKLGFGQQWAKLSLVKKFPILK